MTNLSNLLICVINLIHGDINACTYSQLVSALDCFPISSEGNLSDLIYRLKVYIAYHRSIDVEN